MSIPQSLLWAEALGSLLITACAGAEPLELNPRGLEYITARLQPLRDQEGARLRQPGPAGQAQAMLLQLLSSLQRVPQLRVSSARPGVRQATLPCCPVVLLIG